MDNREDALIMWLDDMSGALRALDGRQDADANERASFSDRDQLRRDGRGLCRTGRNMLSSVVSSQIECTQVWRVVPEIARVATWKRSSQ